MQLQELINAHPTDIIVGDFNIHTHRLQEHRDVWTTEYHESTDFKDYVSFPEENATFDHMLLSPKFKFTDIKTIEGLSDHVAMIYTIE
jgi:endonuclease/exonuclease/phosphatase family metal-dependent hydrolase